ncbi:hypothetical protein MAR_034492, partial [Mya arenaria]
MLNGVISRAELCLSCHLLDAEKEKKARPPLTDREFEGKPGYLVVKAPLEKCIEYLKTYKAVYGDDPVWKNYRRNVVGTYAIRLRTTCIRKGIISTGSACPICRDDYLKFDYRVRQRDTIPGTPDLKFLSVRHNVLPLTVGKQRHKGKLLGISHRDGYRVHIDEKKD